MSEELRKTLQNIIDKNLPKYKKLVLESYDAGEALVPTYWNSNKPLANNLVIASVFSMPEIKTIDKRRYFAYKLSKTGEEIALKLDSERRRQPSLGLGTGPRAPDNIEVLNEEKPRTEEIDEIRRHETTVA